MKVLAAMSGGVDSAVAAARAAEAGHGRAALRLALLAARRGELAEGRHWCARAQELGPAEVATRAERLREALRTGLTA